MILAAYTAPSGTSTAFVCSSVLRVVHGTLCNRSNAPVIVSVTVNGALPGQTARVVADYQIAARDTLVLTGLLADAGLGIGDSVTVTASSAAAVDVLITGGKPA